MDIEITVPLSVCKRSGLQRQARFSNLQLTQNIENSSMFYVIEYLEKDGKTVFSKDQQQSISMRKKGDALPETFLNFVNKSKNDITSLLADLLVEEIVAPQE